jgi:hypothetical protein
MLLHLGRRCLSTAAAGAKIMHKPGAVELWRAADAVCFDVDSTVITTEGIDELALFHGVDVSEITRRYGVCPGRVPQ